MTTVSTIGSSTLVRNQIDLIQNRLRVSEYQVTSGFKGGAYGDYGVESKTLLNFKTDREGLESYTRTINIIEPRMTAMQAAMQKVEEVGQNIRAKYFQLRESLQTDPGARTAFQAEAQSAVEEIILALNVSVDGRFLFSGATATTRPMEDPGAVGTAGTPLDDFFNIINTYTTAGGGTAPATVIANINTFFGTPGNYYLGENPATTLSARIDDATDIDYGIAGNASSFRDILKGIYYYATIPFDQTQADDYLTLMDQALSEIESGLGIPTAFVPTVAVNTAIPINQEVATLGSLQARSRDIKIIHENSLNFLSTEIRDIEEVDMSEAITTFQALQNSLEASFRVTGALSSLSLVDFI